MTEYSLGLVPCNRPNMFFSHFPHGLTHKPLHNFYKGVLCLNVRTCEHFFFSPEVKHNVVFRIVGHVGALCSSFYKEHFLQTLFKLQQRHWRSNRNMLYSFLHTNKLQFRAVYGHFLSGPRAALEQNDWCCLWRQTWVYFMVSEKTDLLQISTFGLGM